MPPSMVKRHDRPAGRGSTTTTTAAARSPTRLRRAPGQDPGPLRGHHGIALFGRLVQQVMSQEPYKSADRVFWIVDNGSSHRGKAAINRLTAQFPNAVMVHTPVHASNSGMCSRPTMSNELPPV